MPKITTIEYDRDDLELLLRRVLKGGRDVPWGGLAIGTPNAQGVPLSQGSIIGRELLAAIIENHEEHAKGMAAEVVSLSGKGMKVKLTRKAEGDSGGEADEPAREGGGADV